MHHFLPMHTYSSEPDAIMIKEFLEDHSEMR